MAAAAATKAAWDLYQSIPRPPRPPTPVPRPLQLQENALLKRTLKEATWDEGVIGEFVGNVGIVGQAWETGRHRLLFFATEAQQRLHGGRVARATWALLEWLQVPRPFTVVLWWRRDPRRLATATEWPSRRTVNGGWTSAHSSHIFIYREEEWDRVLLHELIHALGWDWTMPARPLACWGLPATSRVYPALFEAWTELYAEWLWCVWHFRTVAAWQKQRDWQDFQARQILARYRMLGMRAWSENTSVFAYYVLKAAFAPAIAELLQNGNGSTAKEREATMCRIAGPNLASLRAAAEREIPRAISLCMTAPQK